MTVVRSSKGRPARVFDPAQERQKAVEQLRTELRHQRAENNALQASRLFREFRLVADQQNSSNAEKNISGQVDLKATNSATLPSEGPKQAAAGISPAENRLSAGIWSGAGQPYNCLGQPEEVPTRNTTQHGPHASFKACLYHARNAHRCLGTMRFATTLRRQTEAQSN